MREDRREHIVLPAYHWAESKGVVPVFALSESIKTAASLRPFSVFLRAFDTNEPATSFERSITASGSAHIFVDRNFPPGTCSVRQNVHYTIDLGRIADARENTLLQFRTQSSAGVFEFPRAIESTCVANAGVYSALAALQPANAKPWPATIG
jgi:hypothetical protein